MKIKNILVMLITSLSIFSASATINVHEHTISPSQAYDLIQDNQDNPAGLCLSVQRSHSTVGFPLASTSRSLPSRARVCECNVARRNRNRALLPEVPGHPSLDSDRH